MDRVIEIKDHRQKNGIRWQLLLENAKAFGIKNRGNFYYKFRQFNTT